MVMRKAPPLGGAFLPPQITKFYPSRCKLLTTIAKEFAMSIIAMVSIYLVSAVVIAVPTCIAMIWVLLVGLDGTTCTTVQCQLSGDAGQSHEIEGKVR